MTHINHSHSDPSRGLLSHARVGLVHGRHGEGVAGLGLGVQLLGHVEHPRDWVYPEDLVSVAGHDLQENLGIPPHVLVSHLGGEEKLEFKTEEDFYLGRWARANKITGILSIILFYSLKNIIFCQELSDVT